jgi:hypothetical protein
MNREVHVRIWERPEVRVLRATRQQLRKQLPNVSVRFPSWAPDRRQAEKTDKRREGSLGEVEPSYTR